MGKQYQIAVSDFGNRSGVKIREKFASQRQRQRPRETSAPARFFTRQRTILGPAPASAPPTASFNSGPRSLLLGEILVLNVSILVQLLLQNNAPPCGQNFGSPMGNRGATFSSGFAVNVMGWNPKWTILRFILEQNLMAEKGSRW